MYLLKVSHFHLENESLEGTERKTQPLCNITDVNYGKTPQLQFEPLRLHHFMFLCFVQFESSGERLLLCLLLLLERKREQLKCNTQVRAFTVDRCVWFFVSSVSPSFDCCLLCFTAVQVSSLAVNYCLSQSSVVWGKLLMVGVIVFYLQPLHFNSRTILPDGGVGYEVNIWTDVGVIWLMVLSLMTFVHPGNYHIIIPLDVVK